LSRKLNKKEQYENVYIPIFEHRFEYDSFFAFPIASEPQGDSPRVHANQVWGSVRTEDRNTATIFDKEVSVLIRTYHSNKRGRVLAISKVVGGYYAIDMYNLPAGKYVVQVDTGGSEYGDGQRVIDYPGKGGRVNQKWTLYLRRAAIPAQD